ncbi:probable apyrase 6 isoform X2 [Eutrema salsugineum]|uniref:probable apyrase 6 isoform X2 n=1 Tax=Eutrema salsugineum TaxID=72664 RepID=UPI000CED4B4A|nr:probable apyrase 6 isoform X2 [Eutrema salsugineum]
MRRSHARPRVKSKSDMDPIKFQIRSGNRASSSSSTFTLTKSNAKHAKSNLLLTVASIVTVLGFLFVCYLILFSDGNRRGRLRYSVVIDGGSTGTRIHVFGYRIESGEPVFEFRGANYASLKLHPGLSAYADDPDGASVSLTELVEFAKGRIPKGMWKETEVRLMATAGMRLLEVSVQANILKVTRRVLMSSGFMFRDEWASVISGSDEGVYAWVVANFALGSLGGDPLKTTGIVELGGASAQVTFVSSEPMPPEFSRTISFGNVSYNLYSHSFLHFGQNAAHEKLWSSLVSKDQNSGQGIFTDPCAPKGYDPDRNTQKRLSGFLSEESRLLASFQAGGNYSECRAAALTILQEGNEKCSYQHCSIGSTFTPKLRGRFLATENFFYTSKFFGLGEKAWLSNMISAGERFCGEDWSKLRVKDPSLEEDDLLRYCFSSAYIVSLLHDTLGIPLDDERVGFASQAGDNIPLDWALGAFILQTETSTSQQAASSNLHWFYGVFVNDSKTLFYLIGVPILMTVLVCLVSKWRKPQLKTIYDLEKGRYIVSRIR